MATICNPDWQTAIWSFYRYTPSLPAAALFCALFSLSTFLHIWQMCRTRTWFFTAFVVGCSFESIGYGSRAASAAEDPGCWTLIPFILQSLFILVGPALFAASIYIILGRIVRVTEGEGYSIIKAKWISTIFVLGDVACFSLQSGGSGLLAAGQDDRGLANLANYIVVAGLILQLAWFIFFITVALVFHIRLNKKPTSSSLRPEVRWRSYLYSLYVASGLIVIRSLFRIVEYFEGNDGFIMRHEAFLYVLDTCPIYFVVVWFHWKYPGEIGVLLEGGTPVSNGFKLLSLRN